MATPPSNNLRKRLIEAYKSGLKRGMNLVKEDKVPANIPPEYLKTLKQIYATLVPNNDFDVEWNWMPSEYPPDNAELSAFYTLKYLVSSALYDCAENALLDKKVNMQAIRTFVNLVNSFLALLRKNGLLAALDKSYEIDHGVLKLAKNGYTFERVLSQLEWDMLYVYEQTHRIPKEAQGLRFLQIDDESGKILKGTRDTGYAYL